MTPTCEALTAALLQDEQLDTIECESAEAALGHLGLSTRARPRTPGWYLLCAHAVAAT